MKKLTLRALLTTALATCTMALSTHVQADDLDRQQKRMTHKIEKISKKLDLNDSQHTQWVALAKVQHAEKMESKQKMHELHQQLREAQKQSSADSNDINVIADKIAEQTRQNVLLRVEHQQALQKILNAEQLAKLEKIRERKKHKHDRHGDTHRR